MYGDISTTGINLMDMTRKEALTIYYSVKRSAQIEGLTLEERSVAGRILATLDSMLCRKMESFHNNEPHE